MGKKYAKVGKEYLFGQFPESFRFDSNTFKSIKTLIDLIGSDERRRFLYLDYSIKFLEQLSASKFGKLTGSNILYSVKNYVEGYTKAMPIDTVVLAIDGDYENRPGLKVHRACNASVPLKASEVEITDTECNLDCEKWMSSRSDNEVRKKVMKYISSGLCAMWSLEQRDFPKKPVLIVDSAPVPDGCGSMKFSALEANSGSVNEVSCMLGYEGEQIIYGYVRQFSKKFGGCLHVVDGFTDTDHLSYCCLQQNLLPESRIFLRMKNFNPTNTSYVVDVRSMCASIRRMCSTVEDLAVPTFVLIWGILTGNDFTCVRSGNLTKSIKSVARGVKLQEMISSGLRTDCLRLETSCDGATRYKLRLDAISDMLARLSKKRLGQDKRDLLDSIVSRSEWCLNYFSNPSDETFLVYRTDSTTCRTPRRTSRKRHRESDSELGRKRQKTIK